MNLPLKVLVCLKQVLSKEGVIEIDPSGTSLSAGRSPLYQLNPYDEFALEEALRIKEAFPETRVDVLSVGPRRAEAVIRRGLGMGADQGIHLLTEEEERADPFQLASWIASAIQDRYYDGILTGFMAEDDQEGQTGPSIAEALGFSVVTSVISLQLSPAERRALVEREVEGGVRERWRVLLPAVFTIQSGIHRPRYPSLSNVLRARKQTLEVIPTASLNPSASRQTIIRYDYPEKARAGLFLTGTPPEKAERFSRLLREKGFLA